MNFASGFLVWFPLYLLKKVSYLSQANLKAIFFIQVYLTLLLRVMVRITLL